MSERTVFRKKKDDRKSIIPFDVISVIKPKKLCPKMLKQLVHVVGHKMWNRQNNGLFQRCPHGNP
jgi:hypothetical protein